MLFRLKQGIQFFLKSTNQHGVHSPFIYSLVTQCFYDKKKRNSYATLKSNYIEKKVSSIRFRDVKLMYRIVSYFDYQHVCILDTKNAFVENIFSTNNKISVYTSLTERKYFDLIYIDLNFKTNTKEVLQKIKTAIHKDSLVLIHGISLSENNHDVWEYLSQFKEVTATINTYHFGFIFFRKEQLKEDFFIRL